MTHLFARRAALALALLAGPAVAAPMMRVEKIAVLMRHGVRPPTKDPAMAPGIAAQPWPAWNVKPGYLTQHGADAVALLGRADREAFATLIPATTCPTAHAVTILSDSDQRTIATGDAWARGFAPDCNMAHAHKPEDVADPVFGAIEHGLVDYDPKAADAAIAAGLPKGGIAAVEAKEKTKLDRLDAILCGPAARACGLPRASGVAPAAAGERPKLTGRVDRGSTAAQILLLQYADGKPMAEVGWGRATPADITATGSLHATEFALVARPLYIAQRNLAPIARILREALNTPSGPRVTVVVGHDTNLANLGGLLDAHWQVPGFAADDPAPGGAIILTRLRDATGEAFVRIDYRAQPLAAIRALTPDVTTVTLDIPACGKRADHLCPAATFDRILAGSADLLRQGH